MPVPRQRLSARRGRTRAAHHALAKKVTLTCANCSKPMLPHRACAACGYYKGRNVRTKVTTKVASDVKKTKVKATKKAAKSTKVKPEEKSAPEAPASKA